MIGFHWFCNASGFMPIGFLLEFFSNANILRGSGEISVRVRGETEGGRPEIPPGAQELQNAPTRHAFNVFRKGFRMAVGFPRLI